MAKYETLKKRVLNYMVDNNIEVITTHEMIDILYYNKAGKKNRNLPSINQFAQSIGRDKRFKKLGYKQDMVRDGDGGGGYKIQTWALGEMVKLANE